MATPILKAATTLAAFFPTILRWINGASGENIASDIFKIAQHITGEKNIGDIESSLAGNPKYLVEFQKALLAFEQTMSLHETSDRNSARRRDMELVHNGRQNFRADIMVMAAAAGLASCLLALAFYRGSLPGEAVGIISTVAGIFGSCLKDAYAFEFGSSRGSKDKDWQFSHLFRRA
jgi:hypothetical protein